MATLEELADAALRGDALLLRSLAQDLLRDPARLGDEPRPRSRDPRAMALAAALAELLATRTGQAPPAWTASVGPSPQPFYLVRAAQTMRRLREACERESPPPLRRRRLYAPANFLEFA